MELINKNNATNFGNSAQNVLETTSKVGEFSPSNDQRGSVDDGIYNDAPSKEETDLEGDVAASSDSIRMPSSYHGMSVRSNSNGEDIVNTHGFETYVIPVASTDYKGLEAIDIRLADREWRLENLYTVINEDGELVKFKLRPAQRRLLREMHYKNIILKARQLGFTTFICIFLLDYALFNRNKQIGIIGPTQTDTGVIFRKIKVAWENFSPEIKNFLRLGTEGDSKVEYEFTNGSIIRVSTSLRSGTYQAVLITEFGKISARFPEKAEEIITGTLPAVPAQGLVFIESTAEGEDGRYHEMVQESLETVRMHRALTIKDYKFFFFPWYQNPSNKVPGEIFIPEEMMQYLLKMERLCKVTFTTEQRNWYYLESKIQKQKMKQEHPSTPEEAFLTSGNKLFDGQVIDDHRENHLQDPIEIQGDFLIYRRYVKGHMYGLGADVSQGVKRDSSTIAVIDFTTGELVLVYRSREIDPVTFAHDIKRAAIMYGGCIAAPEANNVGLTTCVQLNSIYNNIYTQVREDATEVKQTNKLGWLTTSLTKPRMMYELSEAIADGELVIYDDGTLAEMKHMNKEDTLSTLVNENTTRHFDMVTAVAIAYQMRAYMTRGKADPEEVAKVEARRETKLHRTKSNYR